jgi:hypothetical protein
VHALPRACGAHVNANAAQQHGVTQSGHDNVFSNSGTYNTFNTNFSIPVFMMNANDFGDVLGDFSPAARYDTGHDGGDSHYNAVDEDNAFFNISSKSKAPYKPPPSASSPTAPPHERDAEPIVDDMIQRCGSCNSISFCHALPDGSFVCLTCASDASDLQFPFSQTLTGASTSTTLSSHSYVSTSTCATTATLSPQSTAVSTSALPPTGGQAVDVSHADAAIELDDSEELEMGYVNPLEPEDELGKITDAEMFALNTRQSASTKREQLTRHLVQAVAFSIACKHNYADAWDFYRDIFKRDRKAKLLENPCPCPAAPASTTSTMQLQIEFGGRRTAGVYNKPLLGTPSS